MARNYIMTFTNMSVDPPEWVNADFSTFARVYTIEAYFFDVEFNTRQGYRASRPLATERSYWDARNVGHQFRAAAKPENEWSS